MQQVVNHPVADIDVEALILERVAIQTRAIGQQHLHEADHGEPWCRR